MSELHSESNRSKHHLTVRVKFVNLNHTGKTSAFPRQTLVSEHVGAGSTTHAAKPGKAESNTLDQPELPGEICARSGERILAREFETHTEQCVVCANRVNLQLDFMETLEAAIFQRHAEPDAQKVHGAMLIGAPELNFAICGEIEFI